MAVRIAMQNPAAPISQAKFNECAEAVVFPGRDMQQR